MKNIIAILITFQFTITFMLAQTWTQFSDFFSKTGVSDMVMNESVICVGNQNGIYCSSDYGKTWKYKLNTQVSCLKADSNYIYAGTSLGFYRSSDKGNSWENTLQKSVQEITQIDSLIFVLCSNGILVSSNHGLQWELSKSNVNQSIFSLDENDGTLYEGTSAGINLSSNKGKTWEHKSAGLGDVMVISVTKNSSFLYAGTLGFISGYNSGVYMSDNDGENWSKITPNMTVAVAALATHGSMIFAGTIGNGVYISTDLGMNWNVFNEGLNSLFIGKFSIIGDTLFAMTDAGIVKTIISKINVKKEVVSIIDGYAQFSKISENWIIPNVQTEQLTIVCPKKLRNSTAEIRYKIFTLHGRTIYETIKQNDSFTIPLLYFPNGFYTITAYSGDDLVTSTFSIIR